MHFGHASIMFILLSSAAFLDALAAAAANAPGCSLPQTSRHDRNAAPLEAVHSPMPIPAGGGSWPMFQKDPQHTGRADYTVPPDRMNDTFFDVFLWQKPSPGGPIDGNFDFGSMPFFDGAGPGGADLVVGTYHWPKGVMGMDRHTGRAFWSGNPAGGELLGQSTPAFSNDGATIYVVNDATASPSLPAGHPFMAFSSAAGPGSFRDNGADPVPDHLSRLNPTVSADGRIFLFAWADRIYAGSDNGSSLAETWAASTATAPRFTTPALYQDLVVGAGSANELVAYSATTAAVLWTVPLPSLAEATPTIDPLTGRIYLPVGDLDVYIAGVDKTGNPLWGSATRLVHRSPDGAEIAAGAGCLSHDGSTYYFETVNEARSGALYAVETATGAVRWRYPIRSGGIGGDLLASSPIVTRNNVIVVGNNGGGTYYAIHDAGSPVVLDSLVVSTGGGAKASATISADGLLYLPLRTIWSASNGDDDAPTLAASNLYCGIDLRGGVTVLPVSPPGQIARRGNASAILSWRPIPNPGSTFGHYSVYASTTPFGSVSGMTPVGTLSDPADSTYTVTGLVNGTGYYFAVTTVSPGGLENDRVTGIGPRVPRDESDLQVVTISRLPRYPRYDVQYANFTVTEPSGFGPYYCLAATGLGGGQTPATQRWPGPGDPVTYVASVRNRGTNSWPGSISARWEVDGATVENPMAGGPLGPGERATFSLVLPWDGLTHALAFSLADPDSRADNNSLAISTRSVAFLAYADLSYLEDFRDQRTPLYPSAATDDFFDWVNRHMARLNQLFADAGSPTRVHYDVLETVRDDDPDPIVNNIEFAVFPFRFHRGQDDFRLSAYYDAPEDIDYGYLHEMGHQLGLIDMYRMNVEPGFNQVNGERRFVVDDLMSNVSEVLSPQSALGMAHWQDQARGWFGQYLYGIPGQIRMRFLGADGLPLAGAGVRAYQKCERPGIGEVLSTQVKFSGRTDEGGFIALPNVPIDPAIVQPSLVGDTLRPNPFGYVNVLGTNGTLLFEVAAGGRRGYAWLDLAEVNTSYYQGERDSATFERTLNLVAGGNHPPDCSAAGARPGTLWPADRRMVRVRITGVRDPDGDPVTIRILGVGSSETAGDGGACPDAEVRGARVLLRAERSGKGHGRTYVIHFSATDAAGASCEDSVTVCVPHSKGGGCRGEPARFDALECGDRAKTSAPLAGGAPAPRPTALEIRRLSPNPSRGVLVVSFALPDDGAARLELLDIAGRRIVDREVGSLGPGEHSSVLAGSDLAPGLYFVRLTASQGERIARVVVVR